MNKIQRTKIEVENILKESFKTSIEEWHTDYNFTDCHNCEGYIFKSELAAIRYIYGIGFQQFKDFCNGACTDEDWINILVGNGISKRKAKRVIENGDWGEVVHLMTKTEGAHFFLSEYSGRITELSDNRYLFY